MKLYVSTPKLFMAKLLMKVTINIDSNWNHIVTILNFVLVCEIMEDITGHVTFIVIPTVSHEKSVENESFNVRTLYDYNPDADEYIPCKELGLFFKKGEILKIHR